MNIIKEYSLEIRITRQDGKLGCDITNHDGVLLYGANRRRTLARSLSQAHQPSGKMGAARAVD